MISGINSLLNRMRSSRLAEFIPRPLQARVRRGIDWIDRPSLARQSFRESSLTNDILGCALYEQALYSPRFQEAKRLLRHGFRVYSQNDEDGIIEQIFDRIGVTDQFFVEFGAGDGLENCTLYCLLKGWSGVWIDGSAVCYEGILRRMAPFLQDGRLNVKYSFITAENIQELFSEMKVPLEFDLLSIDIDGNDYWVWGALDRYKPRVVAVGYNASFNKTIACAVPYNPTAIWERNSYYGASLKAFECLGRKKGYSLVGCNYTGINAFFVRNDCLDDHFAEPFTSQNHYEPPRFFVRIPNGHPTSFGPVVSIKNET